MKPTVLQLVVFAHILVNKIECVPDCKERSYYSEEVWGCLQCPTAKCEDQYFPDIPRCRDACGTCLFELFMLIKIHTFLNLVV